MNYLRSSIKTIIKAAVLSTILSATIISQEIPNQPSSEDTIFIMKKSPWGAVLRSAVIPGFGQFYNESYYKIPIIWGIAAWFVYGWSTNNDKYISNRELFTDTGQEIYRSRRNFYRDERDNFTIYLTILYLLNLVDAYVDAHLFDFTVDEDNLNGCTRFNIRLNF